MPKDGFDNPESLIVAYNQQEHCNLFFNVVVDVVLEQGLLAKQIAELEEGGSPHPKKLDIATIIAMVDEPKVAGPFLVSGSHRSLGNCSPRCGHSPQSDKHPGRDHCDLGCAPNDKMPMPS